MIEFEKLFLRQPTPRKEELVISDRDLRHLARMIWRRQEFYLEDDDDDMMKGQRGSLNRVYGMVLSGAER